MNTRSTLLVLCALCLGLGGCTLPLAMPTALPNDAVTIVLTGPATGDVFPVGPIDLSAQADVHRSTLSQVEFMANGSVIGPGGPSGVTNSYSAIWEPGTAGEYYLQSRAALADGSIAISDAHRICVMPFNPDPVGRGIFAGYSGPCDLPDPGLTLVEPMRIEATVVPRTVQFVEAPGCTSVAPSITVIAQVLDTRDVVALVHMAMYAPDGVANAGLQYLNWITTRSGHWKEYRASFRLLASAAADTPVDRVSSMHWFIEAVSTRGRLLVETQGDLTFVRHQCQNQFLVRGPSPTPEVLEIFPSETPTPELAQVALPTFTFSKNAFCRKGPDTSFPDMTAIVAGDTVDILNVSEDGFWYYVFWKQFNAKCWVAASTGVATGDVSGLKVLIGPELPQPGAPPAGKKPTPAPPPCNPYIKACP